MTEEGDKVKECRETTGPLFLLKELPHHSALMGRGLQQGGDLTQLGLPRGTKLGSPGPFQTVAGMCYFDMETISVSCLA